MGCKKLHSNRIHVSLFTLVVALIFNTVSPAEESSSDKQENQNTFTCGETVKDADGNEYGTVVIGDQCWMTENLRTSSYSNGNPIKKVTSSREWKSLEEGAWSFYNNSERWNNPYGKLYNWYAVNDERNICPANWHVPSYDEWDAMADHLGGRTVAGGKLKTPGTDNWRRPNLYATNQTGFSAVPGGSRTNFGDFRAHHRFYDLGKFGYWWTSSFHSDYEKVAWARMINHRSGSLQSVYNPKTTGYSVRCVKS